MRMFLIAVAFLVVCPGVAFAQLAPQSQEEFEQRFTGWTLLVDAPDCDIGNVVDHGTFSGPGQFGEGFLGGTYEYEGTGANTGTLTIKRNILPDAQVLDLTFNSQTMGTFTAMESGTICEGSFEIVESTEDTTPPSLLSVEVYASGDAVDFTFDEGMELTGNPDGSGNPISITADGQAVESGFLLIRDPVVSLQNLRPTITRGQEVVVTYEDPTPEDDDWGLSDDAGNDAASFTVTAVNNSTVESVPVPALPLAGVGLLGLLLVSLGGWVSRSRA